MGRKVCQKVTVQNLNSRPVWGRDTTPKGSNMNLLCDSTKTSERKEISLVVEERTSDASNTTSILLTVNTDAVSQKLSSKENSPVVAASTSEALASGSVVEPRQKKGGICYSKNDQQRY